MWININSQNVCFSLKIKILLEIDKTGLLMQFSNLIADLTKIQ